MLVVRRVAPPRRAEPRGPADALRRRRFGEDAHAPEDLALRDFGRRALGRPGPAQGVAAAATTYTNHRIKRILQRQSCSLIF